MTEEKSRTPEERWVDRRNRFQSIELKELRRYKRETEKNLRRFKKYSAALEKEVKTLREALEKTQTVLNTVDLSRLEYQDRSKFYDVVFIDGIIDKALKGGEE